MSVDFLTLPHWSCEESVVVLYLNDFKSLCRLACMEELTVAESSYITLNDTEIYSRRHLLNSDMCCIIKSAQSVFGFRPLGVSNDT